MKHRNCGGICGGIPKKDGGKVELVEPLYMHYYFDPHIVYEGGLDRDRVPDFGILLTRHSNCCLYVLLTIDNGHWYLLTEPFSVSHNLRASGRELARKGPGKGRITITYSGSDEFATCESAPMVDTVVISKRIALEDFLI